MPRLMVALHGIRTAGGQIEFRLVWIVRIFVWPKLIGRVGDIEAGRWQRLQKARRFQFVGSRQMADAFQAELHEKGILSSEEFAAKKAELLSRL